MVRAALICQLGWRRMVGSWSFWGSRMRVAFWSMVGALIISSFPMLAPILGGVVFGFGIWLLIFAQISASTLATSDLLASERREGTLEILFLTPLHCWELLLGKLLQAFSSQSLPWLAACPALVLLLVGQGVSLERFGLGAMAFLQLNLCGLLSGLLASCLCRGRNAARTLGFLLAVLWNVVPWILGQVPSPAIPSEVVWLSPAFVFYHACASQVIPSSEKLVQMIGLNHAALWCGFLLCTGVLLIQRHRLIRLPVWSSALRWKEWKRNRQRPVLEKARHRLLDEQPVYWMLRRMHRLKFWSVRPITILWIPLVFPLLDIVNYTPSFGMIPFLGMVFGFVKIGACSRSAEAMHGFKADGRLKDLLLTPVSLEEAYGGFRQFLYWESRAVYWLILLVCVGSGLFWLLDGAGNWEKESTLTGAAFLVLAALWHVDLKACQQVAMNAAAEMESPQKAASRAQFQVLFFPTLFLFFSVALLNLYSFLGSPPIWWKKAMSSPYSDFVNLGFYLLIGLVFSGFLARRARKQWLSQVRHLTFEGRG